MKKNILIISQYFYPEQFRINDIANEFVKRGFNVTVLTGLPNYPEGRIYNGYRFWKKRKETVDGINIIRIPLIARGKTSTRLILNYYSFVISGWFWSCFTRISPDLIFTYEVSPMIQALIGVWLSKKKNIPHFLYVQDLWPENLEVVGGIHNRFVLNHYQKVSDKIYKNCARIFATSPSFVESIRKRVKNKEKVSYLPQYAEDFYKPLNRKPVIEIPNDDRLKIIFTGNIGEAQGLDILPKIARKVDSSICFILVGEGRYKDRLIKETADVKSKFIFLDKQPAERIPELLSACDVAFLSFKDNSLFEKTIPAKLQSYMACGMPILAVASGETKRIIFEAKCGLCCEPGNAEDIVNGIKVFFDPSKLKLYGKNSREYYKKHFIKNKFFETLERNCYEY